MAGTGTGFEVQVEPEVVLLSGGGGKVMQVLCTLSKLFVTGSGKIQHFADSQIGDFAIISIYNV